MKTKFDIFMEKQRELYDETLRCQDEIAEEAWNCAIQECLNIIENEPVYMEQIEKLEELKA